MRQLKPRPLLPLLLLLLLSQHSGSSSSQCAYRLREVAIDNSWQSSYGTGDTCFKNKTDDARSRNTVFYHSGPISETDAGHHFLVLQLSTTQQIVGILVRSFPITDCRDCVYTRSIAVEAWTSENVFNFGSDHCRSRDIGDVFQRSHRQWRLCGVTSASGTDQTVPSRHAFELKCVAKVRTLLLRKKANKTDDGTMAFLNLLLYSDNVTVTVTPSEVHANTEFNVNCSRDCAVHSSISSLRLCLPNSTCSEQISFSAVAQPQHAGNYECQIVSGEGTLSATRVLTVLPSLEDRLRQMTVLLYSTVCAFAAIVLALAAAVACLLVQVKRTRAVNGGERANARFSIAPGVSAAAAAATAAASLRIPASSSGASTPQGKVSVDKCLNRVEMEPVRQDSQYDYESEDDLQDEQLPQHQQQTAHPVDTGIYAQPIGWK